MLVGAEVERAYRDRMALHARGHTAIHLELLILGRQALAVEKQKLAAEKAYSGSAVFQRLLDVLG